MLEHNPITDMPVEQTKEAAGATQPNAIAEGANPFANDHTTTPAPADAAASESESPETAAAESADDQPAIAEMGAPRKSFAELLLGFAAEVVGESDTGDLTPVLVEDSLRACGIELRDQSNGRLMQPALEDMGAFLRQCVAAGAMVHLPQPGDVVVLQYNVSRLYWSGVVESVGATDLGVLLSLPPVEDQETEFQRTTMKRGGLNDAWRVVGFIRL